MLSFPLAQIINITEFKKKYDLGWEKNLKFKWALATAVPWGYPWRYPLPNVH